jgi:hypothetical protein
MAGTNPAFSAAEFRANIQATMEMGLAVNTDERPTFRWKATSEFAHPDTAGNPYDFTSTATSTDAPADVQIPCAVEFISHQVSADGTVFGPFRTPRVVITILDTHFALVQGADEVILGGNTYQIMYVAPPIGLFDCTVYQVHAQAVSES